MKLSGGENAFFSTAEKITPVKSNLTSSQSRVGPPRPPPGSGPWRGGGGAGNNASPGKTAEAKENAFSRPSCYHHAARFNSRTEKKMKEFSFHCLLESRDRQATSQICKFLKSLIRDRPEVNHVIIPQQSKQQNLIKIRIRIT